MRPTQAIIIAGGLGTRLRPFTETAPKPMYPIQGHPYLEYLIEQVKSFGIYDVVLLLGYMPEVIMNHFGDGSRFGVNITYKVTPVEYETGARIRDASDVLAGVFLMLYCDNYCPIDFTALCMGFEKNKASIQLTAYANRDAYTKSNLIIADSGQILVYDKKRETQNLSGVDIGYALVKKEVLQYLPDENVNFEACVYPQLVANQMAFATICEHRYYSVGSYSRIELTEQFFSHRKCAFLDRDGTLNVRPPQACYIENPNMFKWLPGAKQAVKSLNDSGWLVVIISNQPGVARGNMTMDDLDAVNAKMELDLAAIGAHVDAIYTCTHNWDDGCFCRKPKPGMFYEAQRDFNLNLTECVLIGDDDRDIDAGRAARCTCYQVDDSFTVVDAVAAIIPD